jgi:hypothetical protein
MWFTPLGLRPPTLLLYWATTPPTLQLLYCLQSIGEKHKDFKTLTPHRTEDLCTLLYPSSLRYNTKSSIVSQKDLQLALQVLHRMHKAMITQIQLLALSLHHIDILLDYFLHCLSFYLYIQNRPKHG